MNKEKLLELFWYAFFGVVGTAVNILIFYLLSQKIAVHYMLANFIAWLFSVMFAFITNKIWVFKSKTWKFALWIKECFLFVLARVGTCIFDMGYMFLAVSVFHFDETLSKAIANVIVILLNYALSKIWIFRIKQS